MLKKNSTNNLAACVQDGLNCFVKSWRRRVVLATSLLCVSYIVMVSLLPTSVMFDFFFTASQPCSSLLTLKTNAGMGMANQMFTYASAYCIARNNNLTLVLPHDFQLSQAQFSQLDVTRRLNAAQLKGIRWLELSDYGPMDPCCRWMEFHESFYDLSKAMAGRCRDVRLTGLWQSWRYFQPCQADIKRQFMFTANSSKQAREFLADAANQWLSNDMGETSDLGSNLADNNTSINVAVTFVSVHLRLGDWQHDNLTSVRLYVTDAMVKMAANLSTSRVLFVVVSNDQSWCRQHIKPVQGERQRLVFAPAGNSREVDLAILAACNHSIITTGTFAWWGAYLAGGTTIYYDRIRTLLLHRLVSNLTHYFYPGWIPL